MAITTNAPRSVTGGAFDNANQRELKERAEQFERRRDTLQGFVDRMIDGEMLVSLPWGDEMFQRVILRALAASKQWRRDAEKLAVIREVFGGGK
jgi:hypothetical protein